MSENASAAEWLRGIADKYQSEDGFGCKEIVEMLGFCCDEIEMCNKCRVKAMKAIADRIDSERVLLDGIDWPRFEDGEVVKVGDEVEYGGEAMRVRSVTFVANGWSLRCERRGVDGVLYGSFGERVKRPAPKVLDADGVPIEVGDVVYYDGEDEPLRVSHITDSIKVTLIDDHASYYTVKPSRLSHERPDSWEKLEEDANLGCRDYCEKYRLKECDYNMRLHILARAKKLAKVGEVE